MCQLCALSGLSLASIYALLNSPSKISIPPPCQLTECKATSEQRHICTLGINYHLPTQQGLSTNPQGFTARRTAPEKGGPEQAVGNQSTLMLGGTPWKTWRLRAPRKALSSPARLPFLEIRGNSTRTQCTAQEAELILL